MKWRATEIAVLGLIVGCLYWIISSAVTPKSDKWKGLPATADPRLVGEWEAEVEGKRLRFHLGADRTGLIMDGNLEKRRFTWGTENGRLRMNYQAVDFWPNITYAFRFDDALKVVHLSTDEARGPLPERLYR